MNTQPVNAPFEASIEWGPNGPQIGASRVLVTSLVSNDMMRERLVHHVGEALARAVVAQAARHGGFHDAQVLLQEHSFSGLEEMVSAQYTRLAASGFGRFDVGDLAIRRDTKDVYVRVRCHGSPEAESHRRLFGKASLPACWHLVGYSTGWTSAVTGLQLLTVESRCVARGDPHCELETLPYGDFVGPEAAFWKGAFESTSTSLAQELERKQTQLLGALEQLKQQARALRSQTAATVVAQSSTFEEALPHVLESLCVEMGWESGAFWITDEQRGVMRCTARHPTTGLHADDIVALGAGIIGRVLRSARAEAAWDTSSSNPELAASCAFPVFVADSLAGVIEVRTKRPRRVDAEHLSTLAAVGARIGSALAQKRAERASEIRYRLLFDESPLPKVLFDGATFRVLAANRAAADAYGYSPAEMLELTLPELEWDDPIVAVAPPSINPPSSSPELQRTRRVVRRHRTKAGNSVIFEITEHTIVIDGRLAVLSTNIDITEKVRLEEQLRQAQKMEAVGRLAAGIAHEVNNPLTVILGFAEGIERRLAQIDGGEAIRLPVTSIVREAARCRAIVQELLTFSRRSPGDAMAAVDPNEIVRSARHHLEARARAQGTSLLLELEGDVPRIRGNATQLEQVIVNLGNNALDALATGGEIVLRTERAEHGVVLEVRDTGPGMSAEIRARIFEPFFTTKPVGKGTGLGLSLVHEIAQQHGGTVEVASEPNRGARFRVVLPVRSVGAR